MRVKLAAAWLSAGFEAFLRPQAACSTNLAEQAPLAKANS
jgi:hypothetical protein